MIEYLYLSLIPLMAAVRVMRGGLGPQPPRWLMAVLPPLGGFLITHNIYVAAACAALSAQYVSGYADHDGDGLKGWEDAFWDMAIRTAPAIGFAGFIMVFDFAGVYSPAYLWCGIALAGVILSNVAQPVLRQWADRLPGHGNRYVEGLEGAALGALVCAL